MPHESMTASQRDAFCDACRRVVEFGLTQYSSGNLSWRYGEDAVAITQSGSWMGEFVESQIVEMRLSDGAVLNDRKPSVESRFHLGILRARPDVNVVLHHQSPCATAIGCGDPSLYDFETLPEIPVYVGSVSVVGYLTPGSGELADAVIAALAKNHFALLRNHGQVAVGKDFNDAIQKAGFFELVCRILLSGVKTRPLTAEEIARLPGYAAMKRE